MKATWLRRFALLAVAGSMALGGTASGIVMAKPAVVFTTVGLATDASDWEWNASIDGRLVAWECWIGPTHADYAIYVRNLKTGETRSIGVGDGFLQANPDVSGDRVVYQDNSSGTWDIKMYLWASDASIDVAETVNDEMAPKIDGNMVIWKDGDTGYLWYRDYSSPSATPTRITEAADNFVAHDVDNGRVIWSNPVTKDFRVAILRPPVLAGQFAGFAVQPADAEVHGDRIVSTFPSATDHSVMSFDVRPRTLTILADTAEVEPQPTLFHDTYAWVGAGSGGGDIVYSRPGHLNSALGGTELEQRPSLSGHRIVWDRNTGADWDVVLATAVTKLQERTSGANRYATAAAVSSAYFSAGPDVLSQLDNVVLCTGENFPDALSATPLARALQGPLLLTRKDSLPAETLAEITRLAPAKIYIIGGTAAISTAVENQLKATYTTERIAGDDRYDTSAEIATKYRSVIGADEVYRGFFARGDNFPDALALGPIAACAQGPILLVRTDGVPATVASVVDTFDLKFGFIAGDTSAVSVSTATTLNVLLAANGAMGPCVRWAGSNRYETATAVVNAGLANRWIDLDTLGVATGSTFPDALSGGAALGYYGSPVILTSGTSLSGAASTFLTAHEYEIGRVDVFGGPSVVSAAVYDAVASKIK
jgi:beta propeller repeat protein